MNGARSSWVTLAFLAASLIASSALAQSQTPGHTAPRGPEANGVLGIALGQRNFVDFDIPGGVDTDEGVYWSQTYGIGATLRRGFVLISGSLAVQQWIPEARTDGENTFQVQDLMFTTRYAGLTLPDTAFEISPAVTLILPTSQDSLESNLLFGAEFGLDGRWYVSTKVELSISAAIRENSHTDPSTSNVLSQRSMYPPPNGFGALDPGAIIRPTNRYGGPTMMMPTMLHRTQPAISRVFTEAIAADFEIIEQLHARVGYGLYQFVGYRNPPDEGQQPEAGDMTITMQAATIDVVYEPTDWVSIGASTGTFQGLTPPESGQFRFPIWAVDNAELNQSKLRLYGIFYL
jgi:hypothetical protein